MKKKYSKKREREVDDLTLKLSALVACYQKLDAACDASEFAGSLNPAGPLWDAIWLGFEGALEFGLDWGELDPDRWVYWYIWDNQCGLGEKKAGHAGKVRPIRTTRDLAQLILEGRDRK